VIQTGANDDGDDRSGDRSTDRPTIDPLKYQPSRSAPPKPTATAIAHGGEWLTVKARYKDPDDDTSQLISQPVRPALHTQFLPLASAVAEFGLLLRDAPHDNARWDALSRRLSTINAPANIAPEVAELKELVAVARGLARLR
jgi:hypothetical protein